MARRRFFVDEVHSGHARIQGEDAQHLTRVLRVEAGQRFEISDNTHVYLADVTSARKDLVEFDIVEKLPVAEPGVRVTLYASLIKFERLEWLIEKATELGVERIALVDAERSEKGLAAAAGKRLPRWRKIAREASEQSRRAHLPVLEGPLRLTEAIRAAIGARYALEELPGAPPLLKTPGAEVSLLVGPEGGWSDRDRAGFMDAGWTPVSLGSSVLRTETAAIAALATINSAQYYT